MRFKWRRRLAVTAFALGSMLPFAGCSSQQQQASDEVAAEGQGQQEEGGQQEEVAETQQGGESQGEETAQEAPANGEATAEASAEENGAAGNNVVSNEAPVADGEAGDGGDLQSMVTEMNGSNQAQPAGEEVAAPAEAQAAAEVAAPVDAGQVPAEATQVAEAVAVPGIPEMGSKMAYVVEAGDTLGKIASKIYGDQKRWRDIANLSGMDNPNHIYPGDIVYYSLEESSRNFASAYEGTRRAKEIVQDGDTLAAISKRVYGTSKAWRHIWRQNDNIDNPDVLTAGMAVYYVEKGAFNAAMTKVKGMNVAKAAKASAQKVFKSAKVGQMSNVTAQSYAFIGSSV